MKKLLLLVLVSLPSLMLAQMAERISEEGISYFDPEINQADGLMAYQKANGEIWIAELDPITGRFTQTNGDDALIGTDAAPLAQTFNGPEFGYDAQGWRVVYTKAVEGMHEIWQIRKENDTYVSSQVAAGPEARQSALASKNPAANSTRIVYAIGGFEGVMAWKDLSDLETEVVIDSVDRGIRWIDGSNRLAYIKRSGPYRGEIAIYDTDTQTEEIISSDGRAKSNCYGWFAPEYDHQLLVACLIDGDQGVAIYKQNEGVWELFLEFQAPETAAYTYFGSPEAFVASGKSYLSCVVKAEANAYSASEAWYLSLGVTLGSETKVQLKMEDGLGEIIRSDPETFVGENEAFVYYNVIDDDFNFSIYRARTNLETLNGEHIRYRFIKPTETDSTITGYNEPHYVLLDEASEKLDKLLVYFPGTLARPCDYLKFGKTAAQLGYHVILLTYENRFDVNYTACGGTTDPTCHGRARTEVWTGTDTHELFTITPANSILNRLRKLLEYLVDQHPGEDWQQFLAGQNIAWENIVVAGHSQGGGHAGFAAKLFEVDRSIMIAASDWMQGQTALWIRTPGPTPDDRFYGFIHQEDTPAAEVIIPTWEDYGILNYGDPVLVENASPPYNHTHALLSNAPIADEQTRPHNYVIVDFRTPNAEDYDGYRYSEVWEYLLMQNVTTAEEALENGRQPPLFPNPAGSVLFVQAAGGYQIFDGAGRLVMESPAETHRVSVAHLPAGLYFFKTEEGVAPFVKQ